MYIYIIWIFISIFFDSMIVKPCCFSSAAKNLRLVRIHSFSPTRNAARSLPCWGRELDRQHDRQTAKHRRGPHHWCLVCYKNSTVMLPFKHHHHHHLVITWCVLSQCMYSDSNNKPKWFASGLGAETEGAKFHRGDGSAMIRIMMVFQLVWTW